MPVLRNARHEAAAKDPNRFYVYELADPENDEVFYVGKGCGRRDVTHLYEARRRDFRNPAKVERILRIEMSGRQVLIRRVFTGLTEAMAFKRERERIALYGLRNLTNISRGERTEVDRWLAIANNEMAEVAYRLRAWLFGEPFTKIQCDVAFASIRALRECITGLEQEREGLFSKVEEK